MSVTDKEKQEIIEALKSIEGAKRALHRILKAEEAFQKEYKKGMDALSRSYEARQEMLK